MAEHKQAVVVTGALSGIGRAVAERYLSKGFLVIGLDRNESSEPVPFPTFVCDIGEEQQVAEAFSGIRRITDQLNYLVNAAGVFYVGERNLLEDMVLDNWTQTLQTNLTGPMLVIRHAVPLLRKARGDRAIVNISSDQAKYPRRKNSAYAVSKCGVESLTSVCAVELLTDRIRVNAVAPASVKTNFILDLAGSEKQMNEMYRKEEANMPYGLIEAEDVAETVYFLGSPQSSKITGQTLLIDSGKYL